MSLGTTAASLKLPPITAISSASIRAKDWDDVLTAHAEDAIARTWWVQEKKLGSHAFEVEDGIVQVSPGRSCSCSCSICSISSDPTDGSGRLRDGVRELWSGGFVRRRDQDVEHAIRQRKEIVLPHWSRSGELQAEDHRREQAKV